MDERISKKIIPPDALAEPPWVDTLDLYGVCSGATHRHYDEVRT